MSSGRVLFGVLLTTFTCLLWICKREAALDVDASSRLMDGKRSVGMRTSVLSKIQNRTDFKNRAEPIPEDMWEKLDNTECYTEENGDGYPELIEWQRRAPYALIIGAMKAGTSSLHAYLGGHSSVVPTKQKELHFYDFSFDRFASAEKGILRRSARQAYGMIYSQNINLGSLEGFKNTISIDDSPRYLFWSDRIPARVLCVTPWVKILAVLRNPIDRAFSHYNMFFNRKRKQINATFEEWIAQDINDLVETGVIQHTVPLSEFRGSAQEADAWKTYTRLGTHAPIGRGLYSLQLRQWFKAFEDAGKGRDSFLIIQSELMKAKPRRVYRGILEFLGLPKEAMVDTSPKLVGTYRTSLSEETRRMLNDLYAPYNQELYDLLGDEWFGAWDP